LLEPGPALLERLLVHGVAVPEQEVDEDERGRALARELPHAALRRMEPHLHRVEIELPVPLDHDLAVQGRVGWEQLSDGTELREVAKEGPAVAAPEGQLTAVVFHHAAEAVPLRLVAPGSLPGKLGHELGLHGRKRDAL